MPSRKPGGLAIAHPGRLLKREMAARGVSANRLAPALGVPSGRAAHRRITDILNGRRAIKAGDPPWPLLRHVGHQLTGQAMAASVKI
jgi:hypothetical protein